MKLQVLNNPSPTGSAANDFVDATVIRLGREPAALISILQAIQNHFRYLPAAALKRVAAMTDIHPADISGVATFYAQFRLQPVGEHLIRLCHGTACHVKGADLIHEAIGRQLELPVGADTDSEGKFTIEKVACLGCCTLAPVLQAEVTTYGHLTAEKISALLDDIVANAGNISRETPAVKDNGVNGLGEVRICLDSCCVARGTDEVYAAIQAALKTTGIRAGIKQVGCVIMCGQTPMLEVAVPGKPPAVYARVQPEDVRAIVEKHFPPPNILRRVGNSVSRFFSEFATDDPGAAWTGDGESAREIYVVVDRLAAGSVDDSRLRDSLETAFAKGHGRCYAVVADGKGLVASGTGRAGSVVQLDGRPWRRIGFSTQLACEDCGLEYPTPEPRLYSFNSPLGACPNCEGFGNIIDVDMELVVPDKKK